MKDTLSSESLNDLYYKTLVQVFPEGHPVAAPSKERRKRDLDLGIMFTVILDLKAPYSVARCLCCNE